MINIKREELTKEEFIVCRVLYFAIHGKNGVCDMADLDKRDNDILLKFQEKEYIHMDNDCIVLTKEFKEYLEELFEGGK